MGESDATGGYVSGADPSNIHIKCWTSEEPMEFSVSFQSSDAPEKTREDLVSKVIDCISTHIGMIVKIDK
jgi:hypothetical protein